MTAQSTSKEGHSRPADIRLASRHRIGSPFFVQPEMPCVTQLQTGHLLLEFVRICVIGEICSRKDVLVRDKGVGDVLTAWI